MKSPIENIDDMVRSLMGQPRYTPLILLYFMSTSYIKSKTTQDGIYLGNERRLRMYYGVVDEVRRVYEANNDTQKNDAGKDGTFTDTVR
jgi:hypothetical protein